MSQRRFCRFIVHQRIRGESRQVGLFTAAYSLLEEGELHPQDRKRLEQLIAWFEAELTNPPKGVVPAQAVFWYTEVGSFCERMWSWRSS
jgi:hypothetical protein